MKLNSTKRWLGVFLIVGGVGLCLDAILPVSLGGTGAAMAADGTANACGCYQDTTGLCLCGKKSRCGCPGECEPKGCEEKREKEMRKEIEVETRKAQQAGRRSNDAVNSAARGKTIAEVEPESHPAEHERQAKPKHMSPAQKKELLRLLDLYSAEHADQTNRSINELRGELIRTEP